MAVAQLNGDGFVVSKQKMDEMEAAAATAAAQLAEERGKNEKLEKELEAKSEELHQVYHHTLCSCHVSSLTRATGRKLHVKVVDPLRRIQCSLNFLISVRSPRSCRVRFCCRKAYLRSH